MKTTDYNAELKCVWVSSCMDSHNFVKGQVYNVENGRFIDGNGNPSASIFNSLKEINESFYAGFEEVNDDK